MYFYCFFLSIFQDSYFSSFLYQRIMPTYPTHQVKNQEDKSKKDLSISSLNLREKLNAASAYVKEKKNLNDLDSKLDNAEEKIITPVLETELLKDKGVHVEHKPINKYVDSNLAPVRYEGDTMIVSVLKEVVVVEKKTLLVEELHIKKT